MAGIPTSSGEMIPANVAALQHRELSPEDYETLTNLPETVGKVATTLRTVPEYLCAALPRRSVVGGDGLCTVCSEPLQTGTECMKLACPCEFHVECLKSWLGDFNTCPNCKTVVDPESLAPSLFLPEAGFQQHDLSPDAGSREQPSAGFADAQSEAASPLAQEVAVAEEVHGVEQRPPQNASSPLNEHPEPTLSQEVHGD